MRPLPLAFRFHAPDVTDGAVLSCVASTSMWTALAGLPDAVLFHPRLLPALEDLAGGVIEGDLANAIMDLVLNGAEV